MKPDGKYSKDFFLYSLLISDQYVAPVFKMLTEVHNTNFITFWIREFVRLGGCIPDKFCVGFSLAALNAGVCAFTAFSNLNDYVDALYVLYFDISKPIPRCHIRIDISHLLRNVKTCKHFANSKKSVCNTYVNYVAHLQKQDNILSVTNIICGVLPGVCL